MFFIGNNKDTLILHSWNQFLNISDLVDKVFLASWSDRRRQWVTLFYYTFFQFQNMITSHRSLTRATVVSRIIVWMGNHAWNWSLAANKSVSKIANSNNIKYLQKESGVPYINSYYTQAYSYEPRSRPCELLLNLYYFSIVIFLHMSTAASYQPTLD